MCGLAGLWGSSSTFNVRTALERIAHRGPDSRGTLMEAGLEMGHVRLSIMDPEPRSDQPFYYETIALTFNGEIWNFRELRAELEVAGHVFETEGDTEVVAIGIYEWGLTEALIRFDGQFALAVSEQGKTFLARDRFGEIPLYYLSKPGDLLSGASVSWASERKAWDAPDAGLAEMVPPGSIVRLGAPCEVSFYYHRPLLLSEGRVEPGEVLELLRTAVRRRLQSDVPVCCLISGGLDSALILALVQEVKPDVVAYTAAMDLRSIDLRSARHVCKELRVELREVEIPLPGKADLINTIRTVEIPMKTQVEIGYPCRELARKISADGFRVALSGEGADELFGGYGGLMRKATDDLTWHAARDFAVEKMSRGNFVRVNKSFMAFGVEGRLPFVDRDLIDAILPLGVEACPPGKKLLKAAAEGLVPGWVIDRQKETFQGATGMIEHADHLYGGHQIVSYNEIARTFLGSLPAG